VIVLVFLDIVGASAGQLTLFFRHSPAFDRLPLRVNRLIFAAVRFRDGAQDALIIYGLLLLHFIDLGHVLLVDVVGACLAHR